LTFEEIEHEINEALVTYDDTLEQVDEEQKEEFVQYMTKIIGDLKVVEAAKIDSYGALLSILKSEEDRLGGLIETLTTRKKTTTGKIDRVKNYLLFQMNQYSLDKVEGNVYKVRINNRGGTQR